MIVLALHAPGRAQSDRRLSAPPPPSAAAERRVALVVGNDSYAAAPLKNARNDARAVAQALEDVGFRVTRVDDASHQSLRSAVAAFGGALQAGDVALFYFAGHGVQVDGENFLVPVDFRGDSAADVRINTLRASDVQQLLSRARVSLLVLDACRNNPFSGTRAAGGGLAPMEARGSLVAFATGAGQTAADNPSGGNGLFTAELIKVLREPGLSAQDVFRRVRQSVYATSSGKQFPAVYDGLLGEFVFRAGPASPAAVVPQAPDPDLALRTELALWDAIKDSRETKPFEEYLRQYPGGRFKVAAEAKLAEPRRTTEKPAPSTAGASVGRPAQSSTSGAGAAATTTGQQPDARVPGLVWVRIPAGTFQMGCVPGDAECGEDEMPRHPVTLTKAYELMTTELTRGTFERYAAATGRSVPTQPYWNWLDVRPVVNVTWDEAQAVCQWLGGRLPSDVEWERAARAGREGEIYPWGSKAPVDQPGALNGARFGTESGTARVPLYPANAYGLHDMAGNVWEWVADWFGPSPNDPATDPRGPTSGERRVMRGGSWSDPPGYVRVSGRVGLAPDFRGSDVGLRCARDVFP